MQTTPIEKFQSQLNKQINEKLLNIFQCFAHTLYFYKEHYCKCKTNKFFFDFSFLKLELEKNVCVFLSINVTEILCRKLI